MRILSPPQQTVAIMTTLLHALSWSRQTSATRIIHAHRMTSTTATSAAFLSGHRISNPISPLSLLSSRLYSTTDSSSSSSSSSSSKTPQTQTQSASYLEPSLSGYKPPSVNWYPGHIAKAERTLSETLTSADVLLEIRDARIPKSTSHPRVREWTVGKPRIVVMTRVDMVPKVSVRRWQDSLNTFGAGKWDDYIQDGNVRHQARQNMASRGANADNNNMSVDAADGGLVEDVIFVDAKRGKGMPGLLRAIGRAGAYVNERRKTRGLRDRPLRVAVLGYPNVGKSALINRILGRKRAKSANTPGITRALQWIRVRGDLEGTDEMGRARKTKSKVNRGMRAGDFELLDSPGIIPANMDNQEDAILLAICNSIGSGAYDNQGVAAYLCERLKTLYQLGVEGETAPHWRSKAIERYKFDPMEPMIVPSLSDDVVKRLPTGEDMLFKVAENTCMGDPENAARKILQDFRNGRMGPTCLQLPPKTEEKDDANNGGEGEMYIDVRREVAVLGENVNLEESRMRNSVDSDKLRMARAETAVRAAKERGLELPPVVEGQMSEDDEGNDGDDKESSVGKGLFDGW